MDYTQLIKMYGSQVEIGRERYSPSRVSGITTGKIQGNPDEQFICISQYRVAEPHDENVHAALCSPEEWFLKTAQESQGGCVPALRQLQFLSSPQHVEGHSSNGITDHVWTIEEPLVI